MTSQTQRPVLGVWLRLALLLSIAVVPAMILQLKLQHDSLALVFQLADKTAARGAIDDELAYLRAGARLDPAHAAELRTRFESVSVTKRALEAFFLAQEPLSSEVTRQTLWIIAGVLGLSLLGSAAVSRQVVVLVRDLIAQREAARKIAERKRQDLDLLERWQNVARTLVHELRAPITPLKLIASDIEQRYGAMEPPVFGQYLAQSQQLVREQVAAIEAMIASFVEFGRLPKAVRAPVAIGKFLAEFREHYAGAFGPQVQLTVEANLAGDRVVALDGKLLRDLLFNLCKNAGEANVGRALIIHLRPEFNTNALLLHIANNGLPIRVGVAERLFEPYVSTRATAQNMGLGLAVARKIALDHGGDLVLASNDANGVRFCCEIPFFDRGNTRVTVGGSAIRVVL